MKSIAIFDDKCNVCTAFGTLGHQVISLGYSTKPAKKLMSAQFGKDYGFALMLFTSKNVYWGSDAAAQITKISYSSLLGTFFNKFIHLIYPFVVSTLNIILRRKTLPKPPKFKGKNLPEQGKIKLTKRALNEVNTINSKAKLS